MTDPVEQEREKFEAWATARGYDLMGETRSHSVWDYCDGFTESAWEGWKGKAGLS
jgi:hypothetical protein